MEQYQGIVGLFVLIGIAWSCCENRKAIQWRHVAAGLALQAVLAVLLVRLPVSQSIFIWLNRAVLALEQATTDGTTLVFGYLGGGLLPFPEP
ncbi:MAG: nucleoside:proton symporter, partial [Desulfuromonadales bacterium]|nr:nucleoside:proton symporter [Desulfuromonadales bacterium]